MAFTIAITGKGGVGKTTLAALLVSRLNVRGIRPILAVDADPNSCLDAALGVQVGTTVGGSREEARRLVRAQGQGGLSAQELLQRKIADALVEAEHFDLIAMGRPEGPGCYCYANNVLRDALAHLATQYALVVLDNEAGLENLSRRLVPRVDLLIIVTDPSQQGLATLSRLHALAHEMEIGYADLAIVVNRVRHGSPDSLDALAARFGARHTVAIPDDAQVALMAERGEPVVLLLPPDNEVVRRIDRFIVDAVARGSTP